MESAGPVAPASPSAPPAAADLDAQERSFSDVFYRLHPRLLAVAERYVDHETARDTESTVLLELWRRWPQLGAAQRSDEYFIQAVRYAAIDALNAKADWTTLDEADEELEQQFAADHDATERAASVKEVLSETLAAMPPGRRAVVQLLNDERLTYKQAAERLGLSFGTIKTHYRLAMAQLRAAYARAGHRVAPTPRALLADPTGGADHD